jgi:hypothetical protein
MPGDSWEPPPCKRTCQSKNDIRIAMSHGHVPFSLSSVSIRFITDTNLALTRAVPSACVATITMTQILRPTTRFGAP